MVFCFAVRSKAHEGREISEASDSVVRLKFSCFFFFFCSIFATSAYVRINPSSRFTLEYPLFVHIHATPAFLLPCHA